MAQSVRDFFYYLPLKIVFYTLWLGPTFLIWHLTSSVILTLLSFIFISNPLALLITLALALSYPEEDNEYI